MRTVCILFGFLINYVSSYVVTEVSDSTRTYAKPYNPIWDPETQRLYLGDYADGKFLCYIPSEKKVYEATAPTIDIPWYLVPVKRCSKNGTGPSNLFLTTRKLTNVLVEWDGKSPNATVARNAFAVETDPSLALHSLHTAKASRQGHLIFGTIRSVLCGNTSEPAAAGYSYSKCYGVERIIRDQKVFGGFEWNAEGTKIYQIDACGMSVYEHDYDPKTGKISAGHLVFRYQGNFGDPTSFPLQVTVDTKGRLYITIYLGGVVLIVDPITGKILEVIKIPGLVVAGITWGGANLDTLFVSVFSKGRETYTGLTINTTFAGSGVYAVTDLGATGVPSSKLCI